MKKLLVGVCIAALCGVYAFAVEWMEDSTGRDGVWSQLYQKDVQPGWNGSIPNGIGQEAVIDNKDHNASKVMLDMDITLGKISGVKNATAVVNSNGVNKITLQTEAEFAQVIAGSRAGLILLPPVVLASNSEFSLGSAVNGKKCELKLRGSISGEGDIIVNQPGGGGAQALVEMTNIMSRGTITIHATPPSNTSRGAYTRMYIHGDIGEDISSLTYNGGYHSTSKLYSELYLGGTSNQYVNTFITGGKVLIRDGASVGGGILSIAAGAKLGLADTMCQGVVSRLVLGGNVVTRAGTYGASANAQYVNTDYFTGDGYIRLVYDTLLTIY